MTVHYLTPEGLTKLEEELENLKSDEMPKVVERIAIAKELGDLSENAEYQDAKEQQAFIAGRIAEIENIIKNSEVIEQGQSGKKDIVTIGSQIVIKCTHGDFEYTITGSNEANPAEGRISNESPLGRAFLGRKVGERFEVNIPKGTMECEIVEIR